MRRDDYTVTKVVRMFQCGRCNHEWKPRKGYSFDDPPLKCPKCNSPYWNRERQRDK